MESLKGQLLIASPALEDPNFARTVSLMVQHDADGALALVLNRPTEMTIRQAWDKVELGPCGVDGPLFKGGPCEGPLMVLHEQREAAQLEVLAGVQFSAETDKVAWLVEHGKGRAKYVVGYAGWGAGQLEEEFESQSWLTLPASADLVFASKGQGEEFWTALMAIRRWSPMGVRSLRPELMPPDPSLN